MTGGMFTNPVDLMKVRMQTDTGPIRTLRWHIQQVYKHKGLYGYFTGTRATVIGGGIRTGVQLSSYDNIKHRILRYGWLQEGFPLHVLCSFYAGLAVACTVTPVDLVKTRMMNFKDGKPQFKGVLDCGLQILRKEGPRGLTKGFSCQWLRMGPLTMFQFVIWERLRYIFGIKAI